MDGHEQEHGRNQSNEFHFENFNVENTLALLYTYMRENNEIFALAHPLPGGPRSWVSRVVVILCVACACLLASCVIVNKRATGKHMPIQLDTTKTTPRYVLLGFWWCVVRS